MKKINIKLKVPEKLFLERIDKKSVFRLSGEFSSNKYALEQVFNEVLLDIKS